MTTPDRLAERLREDAKIDDAAIHGMWSEERVRTDSRWQAADFLESTATPVPGVSEAFEGTVDGDTPLQAAAREAGWALMEIVDSIDWTKREQVSDIVSRLGQALNHKPEALEAAVQSPPAGGRVKALEWCVSVCDHAIKHYKGPVARKIRREIAVEAARLSALAAPVEAVATEPVASLKLQHVRGHKHTCANVQIDSTIDDKCDCGALDTAGNAIPICSPSGDSGALREALEPFAKLAEAMSESRKPDHWTAWGYNDAEVTYGDFRRARDAYRASGEKAP